MPLLQISRNLQYNANVLAVSYTNMKDMVYLLALKLPLTQCPTTYVPAKVPVLQPGQVIQIIQVIWITFCPGQSWFHPDMLICLTQIKIIYHVHQKIIKRSLLSNGAVTSISRMRP